MKPVAWVLLFSVSSLVLTVQGVSAQVQVKAYTRSDGTHVKAHTRGCSGGLCGSSRQSGSAGGVSLAAGQNYGFDGGGATYWEIPLDCGLSVADMYRAGRGHPVEVKNGNCYIFLRRH